MSGLGLTVWAALSTAVASPATNSRRGLEAGERLALRCWCAPERCHGDLIRDAVLAKAGMATAPTWRQTSLIDLL